MDKKGFVEAAWAAAQKSSAKSGLPAKVTVAQAALESGWGESALAKRAQNYFGIKAHGRLEKVTMLTAEYVAGERVEVAAEFARYASMEECFADRDRILLRGAVYAAAREKRGEEEGFVREMGRHWASDPHYAERVMGVLGEVKEMLR